MATMPILLESTISKDFKPLQDLAIKQPSELEMGETIPFQQLVEASPETSAFTEETVQTTTDSQQDISFQDGVLKENLAEDLLNSEEEPLEAFFAFCSAPLECMKDAREAVTIEETNGQKLAKMQDFLPPVASTFEANSEVKGQDLAPEEAPFLKTIQLENLQAQKMESLSENQLSEFQEETRAVVGAGPSGTNEALLMGTLEQEKIEIEPGVSPILMPENSHKITYYDETINHLNSRAVINQIVDQIPYEALKTEGQQHFKLQIHPKELGEVQVHLVMMEQGKLQATFSGLPYTMDLLQQSSDLLCESLKKEGFDALSENFSFTSDQSPQRGSEREAFTTPTLLKLDQPIQQDKSQLDRLESSMRQLFQHQGSGLSVSLNV